MYNQGFEVYLLVTIVAKPMSCTFLIRNFDGNDATKPWNPYIIIKFGGSNIIHNWFPFFRTVIVTAVM